MHGLSRIGMDSNSEGDGLMKNPTMTFADCYLPYHPERKCFKDFSRLSVEDFDNQTTEKFDWGGRITTPIVTIHSPPNHCFGVKLRVLSL